MRKLFAIILSTILLLTLLGCSDKTAYDTDNSSHSSRKAASTNSNMQKATGFYKGDLILQTAGATLLYDKRDPDTDSLTPDKLMGSFYTETEMEGIIWIVYSVKEYPDLSYVLVISGTNSSWKYQISEQDMHLLKQPWNLIPKVPSY